MKTSRMRVDKQMYTEEKVPTIEHRGRVETAITRSNYGENVDVFAWRTLATFFILLYPFLYLCPVLVRPSSSRRIYFLPLFLSFSYFFVFLPFTFNVYISDFVACLSGRIPTFWWTFELNTLSALTRKGGCAWCIGVPSLFTMSFMFTS